VPDQTPPFKATSNPELNFFAMWTLVALDGKELQNINAGIPLVAVLTWKLSMGRIHKVT